VPLREVPGGRWGTVWIATLAVVIAGLVGLEMFVRARGFVPSVKDDEYSWSLERARASDGSPRTVAILGASRIMLAFSPDAFHAALPGYRFVMLAIQGSQPVASLRDLAFDPEFRGVAVVDVSENGFDISNWTTQEHAVATYHRGWRSIGQLAERRLETAVQSRIAFLANEGLRTMHSVFLAGRWPKPFYTTTFADRTQYARYELTNAEQKRAAQVARLETGIEQADPVPWMQAALAQELYVALIQGRGGKVVYVRMPTCDERWHADSVRYPKELFWDRLAAVSRAVMIHFRDVPALAGFQCPDTSHIASKDGPAFTEGLIDELVRRGVVQR